MPAKCEPRKVISFHLVRGCSTGEIHRLMINIYGNNFIWVMVVYRNGADNLTKDAMTFMISVGIVATEDIVKKMNKVVRERRSFTIFQLSFTIS